MKKKRMANKLYRFCFPVLQMKTHSLIHLQKAYFKITSAKQAPSKYIIEDILDTKYKHFADILDKESEVFLDNLSKSKQEQKMELELMIETMRFDDEEAKVGHFVKSAIPPCSNDIFLQFCIFGPDIKHSKYHCIPKNLSSLNWKVLLTVMDTEKKKMKYLTKLWEQENEKIQEAAVVESFINDDLYICDDDSNPIRRTFSMQRFSNRWKGVQSMMYGRSVIVDMDYESDDFEGVKTIEQIIRMYRHNCLHILPCHLHFTSVGNNNALLTFLETAAGKHIAADFHDEHFLDVFPSKRLFYLTPEGPMIQTEEIDEDTIFILGGLGSPGIAKRSYTKAKMLGIPQGSFPMRKYISFNERTRTDLHLPVVLNILLDKFNGKTWKDALDNCLPDQMFDKHPNLVGELPNKKVLKYKNKLERRCVQKQFAVDRTLEILKSK